LNSLGRISTTVAKRPLAELQWIIEAGFQAGVPASVVSRRKMREPLPLAMAALAILLAVIAAVGWWRSARSLPVHLPMRLSAELPTGAIIDRFAGADVTLSPDGTRMALVEALAGGNFQLAVRRMDQSDFAPLSGTGGADQPFFSPDGQWLGFFADGKLKKVPVEGGETVTLCNAPGFPRGASWGDDGNIVAAFSNGSTGLVRVPAGGGTPTPVTQPSKEKGETAHAWPQFLPSSQAVLFTSYGRESGYDYGKIDVISLKTGERKTLQRSGSYGRYLPSGHLGYLRQNTLFVAPFDLNQLAVRGSPQPALEEVSINVNGRGDFDFSKTGTLAYVSSKGPAFHFQVFWLDSTGQTKPLHVTPGVYENPRFSPDGKRLAFEVATSPVLADIWVKDLQRDTMSRLTHLPGRNNGPLWTPDGKSIVFMSEFQEASGLFWINADGTGEAQRLTESSWQSPGSFSPDGRRLAYVQLNADGNGEIWTAPVEGERDHLRLGKPEVFLRATFSATDPAFSPDGHWLAYSSDESGTSELYVRPFPGPGGKLQISTRGGEYPVWSRKGRQLFFLTPDWHIMVADYTAAGDSFVAGKPRVWFQTNLAFLGGNYPYDLAPDGKHFAVVMSPVESQEQKPIDSVVVLLNFFDELRRKVPPGKN
jgi:serine/threonine-protein kinase